MPRPSPRVRLNSPTPQTPPPSSLAHSLSSSPQNSPSRKGPVENPFQRGFRNDYKAIEKCLNNWQILVKKGTVLIKKIENDEKAIQKRCTSKQDATVSSIKEDGRLCRSLEAGIIGLFGTFDQLTRQYEHLRAQGHKLQELLADAATRKGLEYAFLEPLFLTWSLARFVEAFDPVLAQASSAYHALMAITRDLAEEVVGATEALEEWRRVELHDSSPVTDFIEICQLEMTDLNALDLETP